MINSPLAHDPLTDWSPIVEAIKPEEQVTVAIGVRAEGGSMAIVGSDLRATFPNLRPNEVAGKAWKLPKPFNCGIAAAGILRDCQPYVDHLWEALRRLGELKMIPNDYIEAAIDDARLRVLRRRSDWALRKKYHITLAQWHCGKVSGGKLDPLLLKAGEVLLQGVKFQAQSIIADFIRGRSIFYKTDFMNDVECSSSPGIYAIGVGAQLAMNHLNKREQNTGCSFARSLLHVAEALDEARKEPSRTVGQPSRFLVTASDGTLAVFLPDHPTLLGWKKAYSRRSSTASLQNCKIADMQARGMARFLEEDN
jgi:20S proteasome alpha/beta subunit